MVFTNILDENLKTLGGIHEMRKQKIETYLVPRLGPRTSAPASAPRFALRSGPRAQPDAQVVSAYFFAELHETTMVSRFTAKKYS